MLETVLQCPLLLMLCKSRQVLMDFICFSVVWSLVSYQNNVKVSSSCCGVVAGFTVRLTLL